MLASLLLKSKGLNMTAFLLLFSFQFYTTTGLPTKTLEQNMCAVCGNEILVMNNENAIIEKTCKLTCSHMYPLQHDALERELQLHFQALSGLMAEGVMNLLPVLKSKYNMEFGKTIFKAYKQDWCSLICQSLVSTFVYF